LESKTFLQKGFGGVQGQSPATKERKEKWQNPL
jgi:hypothetical protein